MNDPLKPWRPDQEQDRRQYLELWDDNAARDFHERMGEWHADRSRAFADDLRNWFTWHPGDRVLDCGAGTGAVTRWLKQWPTLETVALEPSPAMLRVFQAQPELRDHRNVCGFCDAASDRVHFPASHFAWIIARQSVNHLYDPLAAFANWHHWLQTGGQVLVIDGAFCREDWSGPLESVVDVLPLSTTHSLATVPYLLERTGFQIIHCGWMNATNRLADNRRSKWIVAARKP